MNKTFLFSFATLMLLLTSFNIKLEAKHHYKSTRNQSRFEVNIANNYPERQYYLTRNYITEAPIVMQPTIGYAPITYQPVVYPQYSIPVYVAQNQPVYIQQTTITPIPIRAIPQTRTKTGFSFSWNFFR